MELRELLAEYNIEELKEICRAHEFKKYSGLKLDDLVSLITTAMLELPDQDYDNSIISLTPSQKFLLWTLANKKAGTAPSNDIRGAFLEKFSRKTYASAQDQLLALGFLFSRWDDSAQDDLLVIPEELLPKIRKAVKTLAFEEVTAEAVEEEKIDTIGDLLIQLSKEELSGFCEDHALARSGTKEQLVGRITETVIDPDELLDLPSKPVLKWACEVLGCKVSGSKDELKARVREKLFPAQEAKPAPKKRPNKIEVGKSQPETVAAPATPPPPSPEELQRKRFEDLSTFLKVLRQPKPKDEGDFQNYLYGRLQGQYGDTSVRQEKMSKGGQQRYDIMLWDDTIIETKVPTGSKVVTAGIGQLVNYISQNPNLKLGILAVFDTTQGRNLQSQFKENVTDKVRVLFW